MNELPVERLVFLDESGVTTKMARTHARAPRGQRAYGRSLGSWQRLTILGALACEGLVATMSIEAATSTPVLLAYLEQVWRPASASEAGCDFGDGQCATSGRHCAGVARKVRDRADDLPRYSPEFNPIEHAWAKVKERLKAKAARTLEALEAELKPALDTITAKDARGWFRHDGYA